MFENIYIKVKEYIVIGQLSHKIEKIGNKNDVNLTIYPIKRYSVLLVDCIKK